MNKFILVLSILCLVQLSSAQVLPGFLGWVLPGDGTLTAGFGGSLAADSKIELLPGLTSFVASVATDVTVDTLVLKSSLTAEATLLIEAGKTLTLKSFVYEGGKLSIMGGGHLVVQESLTVSDSLTIEGEAGAELDLSGATVTIAGQNILTVVPSVNVDGATVLSGIAALQAGVDLAASSSLSLAADADVTISGTISAASASAISLGTDALLVVKGAFNTNDVTFSGSAGSEVEFSGSSASVQLSGSITVPTITVSDSAQAEVVSTTAAAVKVTGDVIVKGSASLSVYGSLSRQSSFSLDITGALSLSAGGVLRLSGKAITCNTLTLSSDTSYEIVASSTTPAVVKVSGEAKVAGEIVLETAASFDFSASTEVTVMTYASVSGSFSSQVLVSGSSRRAIQANDFEMEYQNDKAVATANSGSSSAASILFLSATVVVFALLF